MERIRFNIPTCIDRFSPRHVGLDVYVYINKSIDIDIDINIYIYTDICHDIPIRFFVLQYGRESPDKLMNPTTIPHGGLGYSTTNSQIRRDFAIRACQCCSSPF